MSKINDLRVQKKVWDIAKCFAKGDESGFVNRIEQAKSCSSFCIKTQDLAANFLICHCEYDIICTKGQDT